MTNHTRNKDIGKPGNRGQFAAPTPQAPEGSIGAPLLEFDFAFNRIEVRHRDGQDYVAIDFGEEIPFAYDGDSDDLNALRSAATRAVQDHANRHNSPWAIFDGDGVADRFLTQVEAEDALAAGGYPDGSTVTLSPEPHITMMWLHQRCSTPVIFDGVTPGYTGVCPNCDEDLYEIEMEAAYLNGPAALAEIQERQEQR